MKILPRPCSTEVDFQEHIHPLLTRIYASRGIKNDEELNLNLSLLESPSGLLNVDLAAQMLCEALELQSKILIVGDFDADGATSSALMVLCLTEMGFQKVEYLVPNRFEFGYGLTPEIVKVANNQKPDLIITVDNGISSHDGISLARSLGIKVLVTDHHLAGDTLPEADCIVNPNQPGCSFSSKSLAGVGVVFYLMSVLRAELRKKGWFKKQGIEELNLASYLDIVALGTVADVVPLDSNNRRLVKYGLSLIQSGRGRPGIVALLEIAGRNPETIVASDFGFAAGPRLNAAGRLDDMSLGIECLLSKNMAQAKQMAQQLDDLNKDRKLIEQSMQEEAMSSLNTMNLDSLKELKGICLYDPNWHQGVIGILASRIKERFHRPCIIFADCSEETDGSIIIKGSARSIEGLHIRDLLDSIATQYPKLLSKFGGHAMAAGLSIRQEDFPSFVIAFNQILEKQLSEDVLKQKIYSDGQLSSESFNLSFANELRAAGPWGQCFPEPLFDGEFSVLQQRILGGKHLKLVLSVPGSDTVIDAIAFNVDDSVREANADKLNITYRLDVNEFRGRVTPQLMIQDIEVSC